MPLVDLECYIVSYKSQAKTQKAINSFRETGGSCKLTILDNSPEQTVFTKIDQYYNYPFNPSLTRVWNWALAMSKTDWTLISNTDVEFKPGWTDIFNNKDHMADGKVHNLFYSFFIHKSCIESVGWFDERFTGGYWEDVDYVRRMIAAGVKWHPPCFTNVIQHQHEVSDPRYSCEQNKDWYVKKWGDEKNDDQLNKENCGSPRFEEFNWYPRSR